MFGRLVFAVLLIPALIFMESVGSDGAPGVMNRYLPAYWILTSICGVNLVYLLMVRWGFDLTRLAIFQVVIDIIMVSLLVYCTGIDRVFVYFYFATVLTAGLLINPTIPFVFASLATVLLAMVSILHYLGANPEIGWELPLVPPEILKEHRTELQFLIPFLVSVALSLHIVAFLSSVLAREMNRIRILSQEVVENMAGGILAVDRTGRIAYINREAKRMLKVPDGKWEGRIYATVIPRQEVIRAVGETIANRRRIIQELSLNQIPVEMITTPIGGPGEHEPRGAIVFLNDLTLRKKVEQMGKIEERFEAFVELSTSLAHEIRNPLASIKGASQELATGRVLKDDDQKLLDLLVREVDRLDKILSNFLEYAAPRPLQLRVCNLSKLLEEVATLLEARAHSQRVHVHRKLHENSYCKADEDRLKQVFLNIGINALEAIPKDNGKLLITCQPDGQGGVLVEIEDNGDGISRDLLHKVFDPFFTTKSAGTGMGLSIARKIITAHEGRISLESEVDSGTKVRVWLPS